ncbi:hypothetical protein [Microbispora sp. H13382]|uniref:aromatic-ring hydroxylase C-terminal domain-containing protein n=1 Tax=Microbispora sp. H13382 TaxID=2729112 RepID=UPI0037CB8F79
MLVRRSEIGVAGYDDRVTAIATAVRGPHAPGSLLVRPDGFVAWARDPRGAGGEGLENALKTWFGPPLNPPAGPRGSLAKSLP